jgi:hypothetical protein
MTHDEVTTPWRGPGYHTSGAIRSGKVATRDSGSSGGGPGSRPDEWPTFVTKVQAMTPHSLSARGRQPYAEVVCYVITERSRP